MFDPDGNLLLPDAELEAEARAMATFEVQSYTQDEIWREDWEYYLRYATSDDEFRRRVAAQMPPRQGIGSG